MTMIDIVYHNPYSVHTTLPSPASHALYGFLSFTGILRILPYPMWLLKALLIYLFYYGFPNWQAECTVVILNNIHNGCYGDD